MVFYIEKAIPTLTEMTDTIQDGTGRGRVLIVDVPRPSSIDDVSDVYHEKEFKEMKGSFA
jgi:hypothetical protein